MRENRLQVLGAETASEWKELVAPAILNASKPGETAPAVVLRDGREVRLEVTFRTVTARSEVAQ